MLKRISKQIAVLTVEDLVIFPGLVVPLVVKDKRSMKLVDWVLGTKDKSVGIFTLKSPKLDERKERNFYHIGVASNIIKMLRFPDESVRIMVQGLSRAKIHKIVSREPFMKADIELIKEREASKDLELEALMRGVESAFQRIGKLAQIPDEMQIQAINIKEPGKLADFVASSIPFTVKEKQKVLEAFDVKERLFCLLSLLAKEENILGLGEKIRNNVKSEFGKNQREFFLREQLKAIKKELGEKDEREAEIDELKKKM